VDPDFGEYRVPPWTGSYLRFPQTGALLLPKLWSIPGKAAYPRLGPLPSNRNAVSVFSALGCGIFGRPMELIIEELQISYKAKTVFRLQAAAGWVEGALGILGPNGVGKSSLFQAMTTPRENLSCRVKVNGRVLVPKNRWDYLAYLPQAGYLPRDWRVREAFLLSLRGYETFPLEDWPQIQALWTQRIRTLSTGERRLVEALIILGLNRPLTILDEPFATLEPKNAQALIGHLRNKIAQGKRYLIADHNHHYLHQICAHNWELCSGKIITGQEDPRKPINFRERLRGYQKAQPKAGQKPGHSS
jgi:ABC-type multidrug transport system ATPase subunit